MAVNPLVIDEEIWVTTIRLNRLVCLLASCCIARESMWVVPVITPIPALEKLHRVNRLVVVLTTSVCSLLLAVTCGLERSYGTRVYGLLDVGSSSVLWLGRKELTWEICAGREPLSTF